MVSEVDVVSTVVSVGVVVDTIVVESIASVVDVIIVDVVSVVVVVVTVVSIIVSFNNSEEAKTEVKNWAKIKKSKRKTGASLKVNVFFWELVSFKKLREKSIGAFKLFRIISSLNLFLTDINPQAPSKNWPCTASKNYLVL